MILEIKSLNYVENLQIELSKFNIISGYNDIGKTFILKSIYSVFRSLEYIHTFTDSKGEELLKMHDISEITDNEFLDFYVNKYGVGTKFPLKEIINMYISEKVCTEVHGIISGVLDNKSIELILSDNDEVIFKYTDININGIKENLKNRSLTYAKVKGVSRYKSTTFISNLKLLDYSANIATSPAKKAGGINIVGSVPDFDKDLITKLSKVYLSELDSRVIKFSKDGDCLILNRDQEFVPISLVGDGIKLFAVLDTLIKNKTLNENSILLLDEPDNGLHTSVYRKLLNILKDIKCTVFLTTHNPIFINMTAEDTNIKHMYTYQEKGILRLKAVTAYEASEKLDEVILKEYMDKELDGFDIT